MTLNHPPVPDKDNSLTGREVPLILIFPGPGAEKNRTIVVGGKSPDGLVKPKEADGRLKSKER